MHCSVNSLTVLFIVKILMYFYNDIILALKTSGTNCTPMSKSDKTFTFRAIAGWNEYVKEHYSIAQNAFWWWKLYNKPKIGAIYHKMRSTKAHMHSVLLERVKK